MSAGLIVANSFDDALQRIYACLRLRNVAEVFIESQGRGFDCVLKFALTDESDDAFRRYWHRLQNLRPFDVSVKPWADWRMRDFWLINADRFPLKQLAVIEQFGNEKSKRRNGLG